MFIVFDEPLDNFEVIERIVFEVMVMISLIFPHQGGQIIVYLKEHVIQSLLIDFFS